MPANWENLIHKRVALAKLCLANENFASFHVLAADQARTVTDTNDLSPEHKADIENFNTGAVDAGEQDYKEFSDKVERLKEEPADPQAWELKIKAAADAAKGKAEAAIDRSANDAINYIKGLPPVGRDIAGNIWAEGLTGVVTFFEEVYKGLQAVVAAIVDFFRGIWDQITNTWNTVKNAAKAAISFIKGIFSLSVSSVKHAFLPNSTSLSHLQDQVASDLKRLSFNDPALSRLVVSKQASGWEIDIL
ncbi:hypothetical protein GGS24DRAFT_505563 [Hypoxylon argillaceum]|nr:hypothetical protein GGS24DRAFT_505563 [Hypoxylon argillaceum]